MPRLSILQSGCVGAVVGVVAFFVLPIELSGPGFVVAIPLFLSVLFIRAEPAPLLRTLTATFLITVTAMFQLIPAEADQELANLPDELSLQEVVAAIESRGVRASCKTDRYRGADCANVASGRVVSTGNVTTLRDLLDESEGAFGVEISKSNWCANGQTLYELRRLDAVDVIARR